MPSPALAGVSFTVPAGKILGVVGHSGSGKTTLTRLIQGINQAQGGVIRIDGVDIRNIDLTHLRSRIGVVLQDNFLFRGTVRENIALPRPGASFEEVVAVASLAGADEFIERLPQGFDTPLEENASNLSGGQRQRLAIARALIVRPGRPYFRRGDERARSRQRGDHSGQPAPDRGGTDGHHRLAPARHARRCRRDPGAGARAEDRLRAPCRIDRDVSDLCRPVAAADEAFRMSRRVVQARRKLPAPRRGEALSPLQEFRATRSRRSNAVRRRWSA